MKLRLAPSAIADIEAVIAYLSADSPTIGLLVADRFEEVFRKISDFPETGRRTTRKEIRYAHAHPYPYLIFYKFSPSMVEVVAVRHGARSPKTMPARPR